MRKMKREDSSVLSSKTNKIASVELPEYWSSVLALADAMKRKGVREDAGFQESFESPNLHTLIIGVPGSGYETVANAVAKQVNKPWICGDRLGYRSESSRPDEWLYDLDSILWELKHNHTPSVYSFGGSGAANLVYLPWKEIYFLCPHTLSQYVHQVVKFRKDHELSDLPAGYTRYAQLEQSFIRECAALLSAVRVGRSPYTLIDSKPDQVDLAVKQIVAMVGSEVRFARQNKSHSLAAVNYNNILYIRQRTSGKYMSSWRYGGSCAFAAAYAQCTEPLDQKTAENIVSLILEQPDMEQEFHVKANDQTIMSFRGVWRSEKEDDEGFKSSRVVFAIGGQQKAVEADFVVVKMVTSKVLSVKFWSGTDVSKTASFWNMTKIDMPSSGDAEAYVDYTNLIEDAKLAIIDMFPSVGFRFPQVK